MKKIAVLLLVLVALGVMSSVATAANGVIWPTGSSSAGYSVR